MANSSNSDLSDINNAIKSQNIFKNIGVFRSHNIWGRGYPDVATFNAHASDAVLQALDQVRKSRKHKVTSLVLTATQGQGKTHLINRVRRQLAQQGNTVFVYTHVLNFTDLDQVNFYFQQTVVDSLSRVNDSEVTQWQVLATAIVNQAVKNAKTPQDLVEQFDKAYQNSLHKGKNLLDLLIQKIHTQKSIDPYILRAVLWTLSKRASSYAEKWLSGEVLEDSHARYLGLPTSITNHQDREANALSIVKQIFSLISDYSSIIICFDEIDTGEKYSDAGLRSSQVVTILIKSLYDTLEQSKLGKGVVILTVMMPDTHRDLFDSMADGGISARLSTFTENQPIELKFLDPVSMTELVKLYLEIFYNKKNITPPTPIYPFDEEQLQKYAQVNKPTVREALHWCAENFKVEEDVLPNDPRQRFDLAINRESDNDFTECLDDSEFIAHVLRFGFTALVGEVFNGETSSGEQLNNLIIQDVVDISPKSKNNDWINFKIIGSENNHDFKVGIMVLQHTHGLSVGAGMNRIIDYETFDLTRGCIVRSKSRKIKSNWDSYRLIRKLIKQQGGEWVDLTFEDVHDLIRLYTVNEQKDAYRLTEDQVIAFTKDYAIKNPLLLEILSSQSGGIDESSIEVDSLFDEDDKDLPDVDIDTELNDLLSTFQSGQVEDSSSLEEESAQGLEGLDVDEAQEPQDTGEQSLTQDDEPEIVPEPQTEVDSLWFTRTYTRKGIKAFLLNDNEYDVTTWREFLITVCTLMKLNHNKDFAKVLQIKGKKNAYFSKNPKDLKSPEKISGSGIYVETNLSSNQIVKFVYRIVTLFNYSEDCIQIILDEG
ncbi:ATP-binding protein [Spirulina major CS-329]|uniref:ATP-binding protein n=1 Tax=Spirulina TaxID=1154 RepID=UPI00232DDA77|nr:MULTISPECIES: ATP-binding protein [Spirulina]MDB9493032.1 ATP-binding protein [Spirulina subsalsa CS-330]MDB9504641.1 ATP-binding protein [Spirulina major CS-329]